MELFIKIWIFIVLFVCFLGTFKRNKEIADLMVRDGINYHQAGKLLGSIMILLSLIFIWLL